MTSISLPVQQPPAPATTAGQIVIALAGNPNAGKTTLFNQLTGLRAKTANFPGTTIEARVGKLKLGSQQAILLDLPGLYSLHGGELEEQVAADALHGRLPDQPAPKAVIVVLDATNLARNLYLAGQVRELNLPCVVALNMIDLADQAGIEIDVDALAHEMAAPIVKVNSRSGQGVGDLLKALEVQLNLPPKRTPEKLAACGTCSGCPHQARFDWAEGVGTRVAKSDRRLSLERTQAVDRYITHPVLGLAFFAVIMASVFVLIFYVASFPMEWIESAVQTLSTVVASLLPANDVADLIVNGIIGGVGGVVVFLPQICLLFFALTILEDTGYLARAAFVMDHWMQRIGLPGKAFIPMLSAHACAIPAIMSTRVIESRRDRLLAILTIPLLTCSARLPVYAMIAALLFAGRPLIGGLVFTGGYLLGIVALIGVSFILSRTILPGRSQPLLLELPTYKFPSFRNALLNTYDRGIVFLKRAGTLILLISIVIWAMTTYPKLPEERFTDVATPALVQVKADLTQQLAAAQASQQTQEVEKLTTALDHLHSQVAMEYSVAGRLGKAVEPVFRPLGYDWKINVGVMSSFAAREVVVSTLAIVYGIGEEGADDQGTLTQTLAAQTHPDGTPVFTLATALSLLVFYVLAMQCLATQAVTWKQTGSWKWAALQLSYMTVLAWSAAFITYQTVSFLTR